MWQHHNGRRRRPVRQLDIAVYQPKLPLNGSTFITSLPYLKDHGDLHFLAGEILSKSVNDGRRSRHGHFSSASSSRGIEVEIDGALT